MNLIGCVALLVVFVSVMALIGAARICLESATDEEL
jgi:hypothetical protein